MSGHNNRTIISVLTRLYRVIIVILIVDHGPERRGRERALTSMPSLMYSDLDMITLIELALLLWSYYCSNSGVGSQRRDHCRAGEIYYVVILY